MIYLVSVFNDSSPRLSSWRSWGSSTPLSRPGRTERSMVTPSAQIETSSLWVCWETLSCDRNADSRRCKHRCLHLVRHWLHSRIRIHHASVFMKYMCGMLMNRIEAQRAHGRKVTDGCHHYQRDHHTQHLLPFALALLLAKGALPLRQCIPFSIHASGGLSCDRGAGGVR